MKGFFFIDKEEGWTSFEVVREIRRIIGVKKVGHAGTLDAFATGLLIVAVGEATKLLEFLLGCDKEYEVEARFGAVSDTMERTGKIESVKSVPVTRARLAKVMKDKFVGEIMQLPPKYSALKVGGRRASDIVRSGGEVDLKPRKVRIDSFKIVSWKWPTGRFLVKCSSGTYIRSLIHDLGQALSCGAYVENLRRTRIDGFSLAEAVKLGVLSKTADRCLVPMEKLAEKFSCMNLADHDLADLADGKICGDKKIKNSAFAMAFNRGKLVGVLEKFRDGVKFKKRIF